MDPNLTYSIVITPTLNATLYQPPASLNEWLKANSLSIGQILTAIALALLTYGLLSATRRYADQVEVQTNIMNKKLYQDIGVLRYRRLCDEMDKLYAPLYSAVYPFKNINENIYDVEMGKFKPTSPSSINEEYIIITEFWDRIRQNMYLSRSAKLLELLESHFLLEDERKNPKQTAEDVKKTRKRIIDNIKDIREEVNSEYEVLKQQIKDQEKELDIDKVFLKAEGPVTLTEHGKKLVEDHEQAIVAVLEEGN